jgi:hypothetical protein
MRCKDEFATNPLGTVSATEDRGSRRIVHGNNAPKQKSQDSCTLITLRRTHQQHTSEGTRCRGTIAL